MRKVNEQKRGLARAMHHQHPGQEILERTLRRIYTVEWEAYRQDGQLLHVCDAAQAVHNCLQLLAGKPKV